MDKLSQISVLNYSANYGNNFQGTKFQNSNTENTLERTPQRDFVSFSGNLSEAELNGKMNIEVSDRGFSGKRKIRGTILDKRVDLTVKTAAFNTNKVMLSGTIDKTPVKLEMNKYKLTGDISDQHKDVLPYIKNLMIDKRNIDKLVVLL